MKKIAISLGIIGVVAAIIIGATTANFFDVEKSTGNTLTAGIIDIVVNGENPWEASFTEELKDMKPCQTRYIEFTVRNLEDSNPINLWKHINITDQNDGVITEPECEEGGGTWISPSGPCEGDYVPRNNLAAYIIYDLYVNGEPIISENQYVRLDNISSAWIYLGTMQPGDQMVVKQSYHLSSWPNAPEPEVTNWAQGDIMTFDIELMATQLEAPGPKGVIASLTLENKDSVTWNPITGDGISGQLTYNTSGSTFDYSLTATGLAATVSYSLIYYADPWPGNHPGALIGTYTTDGSGAINVSGQSVDLGMDLPTSPDSNAPAGAKIQLVLSTDYDGTKLTAWNPSNYLFEMQLIIYDDTDN